MGYGPDFRRDETVDPLNLLDIAPLMLALLGLPVPKNLEGRVPVEVLEPGFEHELGEASRTGAGAAAPDANHPSAEEREVLLRQMKKLGYMD